MYIEAAKFNEYGYNDKEDFSGEDLFSLSENYSELRTAFNTISDEFLFLIDSLDEIEEGKLVILISVYIIWLDKCVKKPIYHNK